MLRFFTLILMGLFLFGCSGPNFNEVQIARLQADTARIEQMKEIEVARTTAKLMNPPVAGTPLDSKFTHAGFLIETDEEGKIKTVFIGEGVINKGSITPTAQMDTVSVIANYQGYVPKESYVADKVIGAVGKLAKYGLIGYGINQIAGAVGDDTTTYSAGGDQSINTGMNGTSSMTSNMDSFNDMSNQGNDLSDNSDNRNDYANDDSDNRYDYNNPDNRTNLDNDNRTDYGNGNPDPTVVDPVIVDPVIVPPPVPSVVDPVVVPVPSPWPTPTP